MSDTGPFDCLEEVYASCRYSALRDWRGTHAPAVRLDDLFATALRRLTVATQELPEGGLDVWVRVQARRPTQHEQFFYKFRKISGVYYQY